MVLLISTAYLLFQGVAGKTVYIRENHPWGGASASTLRNQTVVTWGVTALQRYHSWFLFADEVERKCNLALRPKALPAVPESLWRACVCQVPKWRARAHPLCHQQTHGSQLAQPWHPDLKSLAQAHEGDSEFFSKPAGHKEQTAATLPASRMKGRHLGAGDTSVPVKHGHLTADRSLYECKWKSLRILKVDPSSPVQTQSSGTEISFERKERQVRAPQTHMGT